MVSIIEESALEDGVQACVSVCNGEGPENGANLNSTSKRKEVHFNNNKNSNNN